MRPVSTLVIIVSPALLIARSMATAWLMTAAVTAHAQTSVSVSEGDFIVRNFAFASGEILPEVRLHYRTVGTPRKDASGTITNGVLVLHGTDELELVSRVLPVLSAEWTEHRLWIVEPGRVRIRGANEPGG